jgi:hypothetical protein
MADETAPVSLPLRRMTQAELDAFLEKAADILRGNVDHSDSPMAPPYDHFVYGMPPRNNQREIGRLFTVMYGTVEREASRCLCCRL